MVSGAIYFIYVLTWRMFPHFRVNYMCASWCHSTCRDYHSVAETSLIAAQGAPVLQICFQVLYRTNRLQMGDICMSTTIMYIYTYIYIYMHGAYVYIYIYICRYVTYSHLGVDRTWTLQNILTNGNDLENPIIYVKMTTIYLIIKQK